ncbi:MAG: SDR family oxidoreductase [Gammaproteobacteria bacterium]|jgi:NAD(P)-dependent dehydrogenase (short-subunit alcohol dehydrogenase family)|nr:SDR family oxidoreductase [Gammaproteobacteria bacterium]
MIIRKLAPGLTGILLLAVFLAPVSLTAAGGDEGYIPTVLITGSNRGLGFEFVKQYTARGWKVIATARKPDAAEELQAFAVENSNVVIEQLDIADLDRVDALAEQYKDQPIDVLLNNGAISGSPDPKQLFGKVDYDRFDQFMDVNLRGPLKVSEAFLPHLKAGKKKRLVVMSSKGGSFAYIDAMPSQGTMLYRTSKAALNMLMVNVADAVKKDDIVVVLLNPGLVDTQGMLTKMNEKMNLGLDLTLKEDSIAGMIEVIENTTMEDSAKVFQYTGQVIGY